jgi:hypothetical protein
VKSVNRRLCCLILAAIVALGSIGLPNRAMALDGNELLAQCTNLLTVVDQAGKKTNPVESAFASGSCTGIAFGVTHTIITYNLVSKPSKPLVCLPDTGITNGQAVRIIVKFMQEHPQDLHQDAGAIAVVALGRAFPCAGNRKTAN